MLIQSLLIFLTKLMRTILLVLLMTHTTQAGAGVLDVNFVLKNTNQMAVSIRDDATGGCWTNLRESREYAEEKLRISGAKVRNKADFTPLVLEGSYYLEIFVHAQRAYKDGSGGCQGAIAVSIYGGAFLNKQYHAAIIFEDNFITSQNGKVNDDVIEAIGISFTKLK
jgi:hypothetical protein